MADVQGSSQKLKEHSSLLYDTLYGAAILNGLSPPEAAKTAAGLSSIALSLREIVAGTFGGVIISGAELGAAFIKLVGDARKQGAPGLNDLISSSISEVLQIEIPSTGGLFDSTGASGDDNRRALGSSLLSALEKLFVPGGAGGAIDGEKAAQAMAGFNMSFAAFGALFAIFGEATTLGFMKDFAELPELMEKSLGLGRLLRRAIGPLVQNTIAKPYDRQLRARYRQDFLPETELVKGMNAGRLDEAKVRQLLAEKGLPDEQIAELIAQLTPSLHESDIELLQALGKVDITSGAGMLKAQGIPDSIAGWRLQVLAWKRLQHVREALLSEVFSQIQHGFQPASAMDDALSKLGIPADESELWRQRVGALEAVPRKRLSVGEMLFLFENSQVTLNEVQQWAEAEGYSQNDQLNLQLYFELKATSAHRSASGTATAAAAHVHDEHVAWVTDTFAATFGDPPTAAELAHWVTLLDNRQRTKADVKAEMKAGQTGG